MSEFLDQHPRSLHELVASDPLVGTRVFHWTVKLVVRTLFNCADKTDACVDHVSTRETPGVFGHVRGDFGVVEPQMRKALHIHMLIQLLGFMHPDDLFGRDYLQDTFRRLWYFVASISFRSTEGFANYLNSPAAMERSRSCLFCN